MNPFLPSASRLLIFFILITVGCSKAYKSAQFDSALRANPSIAVLPHQIIFQGKIPKNLTADDMAKIDSLEAIAFQKSFFRWLGSAWRNRSIRLQSTTITNARLERAGIDLARIEDYAPDELARIAGVRHVFACVAVKHRYRSDLASLGIEAGNILLQGTGIYVNNKSKDVNITANLIDGSDGSTLWSHTRTGEASWDLPVTQVMDNVHRRVVRKLPKK